MIKRFFQPSADSPVLQWLGLIIVLLLFFLCLIGVVVWFKTGRANRPKRKRKHRHHRPINPTLSQTGGLPPKREPNQPPPGP